MKTVINFQKIITQEAFLYVVYIYIFALPQSKTPKEVGLSLDIIDLEID